MQPDEAKMDQPRETVPEQPTKIEREQPKAERVNLRADEAEEDATAGAGRHQP